MFAMTLTGLLLATATPVTAQLDLQQRSATELTLELCFQGTPRNVRFELEVTADSGAGRSRSRQAGSLLVSDAGVCPLRNRMSLGVPGRVEARLRWWLEGEEQPAIQRVYP